MMVNFLLMCLTLITITRVNPALAQEIKMVRTLSRQRLIGFGGVVLLLVFLTVHTVKDLNADIEAWYFRSTPIWLIVMGIGSTIYYFKTRALKRGGKDLKALFTKLPKE